MQKSDVFFKDFNSFNIIINKSGEDLLIRYITSEILFIILFLFLKIYSTVSSIVRIFKFYIFQLLYDLLFILPAYCIYIYFITIPV